MFLSAEVNLRSQKSVGAALVTLAAPGCHHVLGVRHYDPFPLAGPPNGVAKRSLTEIKAERSERKYSVAMEWQTIRTAPFGRDLQLAVINAGGVCALVFPCRRVLRGWVKTETNEYVYVRPTHWREWRDSFSPIFPFGTSFEQSG